MDKKAAAQSVGNPGEFIPTHEWQVVQEGQAVPAGLHIKFDMTTGGKWAKLLDDGKQTSKALVLKEEGSTGVPKTKTKPLDIKAVKEQLKNFKETKKLSESEKNTTEKKKFRSMEEIREELGEYQMVEEADFTVMKRLLVAAADTDGQQSVRLHALQELEYYLHQVDNANDFIKIDGLKKMMEILDKKCPELRAEAIHVMGTAIQGNQAVQIRAVEIKAVEKLLALLNGENEDFATRKKCLYSLSCLLRHFPHAQHLFSVHHGFETLARLLAESPHEKLKIKAMQLVSDLQQERVDTEAQRVSADRDEKLNQYRRFNLTGTLLKIDWCEKVVGALAAGSRSSLDLKEKAAEAMLNLLEVCHDRLNENEVQENLITLLIDQHNKSIKDHEDDEPSVVEHHISINQVRQFLTGSNNNINADTYRLLKIATDFDELESFVSNIHEDRQHTEL